MSENRDRLEMDGIVTDVNKGIFKVKVNESMTVQCTLSGKIRMNSVKILLSDKVKIEVSTSDLTKGRIIFRNKN